MRPGFRAGEPPEGRFDEVGRWDLHGLGDIRPMRAALAALLPTDVSVPDLVVPDPVTPSSRPEPVVVEAPPLDSLRDRLLLVASELASNALRHGGGEAVVVLARGEGGWLLEVSDPAVASSPSPAVDRTPAEGGYGLYLVQALGQATGWYAGSTRKHVWTHVAVL